MKPYKNQFYLYLVILASSLISASTNAVSKINIKKYKEIYREHFELILLPPFNIDKTGDLKCPTFKEPFIFGGRDAVSDEFPHMASPQYKNIDGSFLHGCGATLISDQYLLTAAHCIDAEISPGQSKSPDKIIMGDISLMKPDKLVRNRKEMGVSKIIVHPEYNSSKSRYHDIALIKLDAKVKLVPSSRPGIHPACLAQSGQTSCVVQATVTGWGRISEFSESQNLLQAANLTVQENGPCEEVYAEFVLDFRSRFPEGLESNEMCAGEFNKDTCRGDSGGPLTIKPIADLPCMDYVAGITSLGPSCCGDRTPAIYTRVEKYIDWIEGICLGKSVELLFLQYR